MAKSPRLAAGQANTKIIIPIGAQRIKLNPSEVGGKATNLQLLHSSGYKIPKTVVIPAQVFDLATKDFKINSKLNSLSFDNILPISQELQELFKVKSIREMLTQIITEATSHFSDTDTLAIRSSANVEDSAKFSFAGQFDTFLDVQNSEEEITEAIIDVWESSYSIRALAYCLANDINPKKVKMPVILQQMINAAYAGTAFSIDVENNDKKTIVVQAAKGSGEGVVDGTAEITTYKINKDNSKSYECEGEEFLEPTLLSQLVQATKELEIKQGSHQDLEWAIDENGLWLLQTRPITTE